MRIPPPLSSLPADRAQARLASSFSQHVAVAVAACLLGLILG